MNPKISIITVNYNDKAGLQKTIKSVADQSYKDFEFFVIDGDSTDGSKKLLEENVALFTHWLSEPDRGIYHAMNKGIKMATGEYLLFLNSGDSLYNADVLKTVNHEINGAHDIYYGDIIYDEISKQTVRTFPDRLTFGFFYEHNLSHQASFIRRTLFDEFFYYNESFKIVSDWEFFIYAICKKDVPYQHINSILTNYDATGLSSNVDNHVGMRKERAATLDKYFPAFKDDYILYPELQQKRTKQFLFLKQNKVAWRVLKTCMSTIQFFLPKQKG
ncbi:glycosyltransferase [Pedobacter sp. N36a]|uniref:glycosyltransferase family 2 protein n=1 Tax=Pedobacter sp. N36a TaxID=2767996 RepID=UPI0016568FB3|nr:glycosyltransferase family 2 protein [Pedobacter sp. N36a]MBC8985442.1 glycosyltransferase [Pedobacter sp. N36a]